jgi:hypothetical protein
MQCMAYRKRKNPSIWWIFEKCEDASGCYTGSALLYQCIMSYAIELNKECLTNGNYESFTTWQLTDWLITNHDKYRIEMKHIPYRNMTRKNRIAAKLDGVTSKVGSLMILNLIEEKGLTKASRGKKQTTSLGFNESGYLLGWIIESVIETKRQNGNIQIYKILEHNYKDRPSSFDNFALRLMEKFRVQGVFEEFTANTLRERVNDPKWHIDSMSELISSLSMPDFGNVSKTKLFHDIWFETLNELEENQRNIIMQYVKLNLGRRIENQLLLLRGYEELRYSLRDKPNILAVEGVCNNCNRPCHSAMDLVEYIEIEKSPYLLKGMDCPWCRSSDTVSIQVPYGKF